MVMSDMLRSLMEFSKLFQEVNPKIIIIDYFFTQRTFGNTNNSTITLYIYLVLLDVIQVVNFIKSRALNLCVMR